MEDQHVITVTVSNNNILKEIKQSISNTSSFSELINDVRVVQKSTNAFLTQLVENEKLNDATQKIDDEEIDDDDDDEDENLDVEEDSPKRKVEESPESENKLKKMLL